LCFPGYGILPALFIEQDKILLQALVQKILNRVNETFSCPRHLQTGFVLPKTPFVKKN
jgi:hypothetical protein